MPFAARQFACTMAMVAAVQDCNARCVCVLDLFFGFGAALLVQRTAHATEEKSTCMGREDEERV